MCILKNTTNNVVKLIEFRNQKYLICKAVSSVEIQKKLQRVNIYAYLLLCGKRECDYLSKFHLMRHVDDDNLKNLAINLSVYEEDKQSEEYIRFRSKNKFN